MPWRAGSRRCSRPTRGRSPSVRETCSPGSACWEGAWTKRPCRPSPRREERWPAASRGWARRSCGGRWRGWSGWDSSSRRARGRRSTPPTRSSGTTSSHCSASRPSGSTRWSETGWPPGSTPTRARRPRMARGWMPTRRCCCTRCARAMRSRPMSVYARSLGGFPHLGLRLGDMSRGARVTATFAPEGDPRRLPESLPEHVRYELAYDWGLYTGALGQLDFAVRCYEAAAALAERTGAVAGLVTGLRTLGYTERLRGQLTSARRLLERSLSVAREHGARGHVARTAALLGLVLHDLGEAAAADEAFDRAREMDGAPVARRALWQAEHDLAAGPSRERERGDAAQPGGLRTPGLAWPCGALPHRAGAARGGGRRGGSGRAPRSGPCVGARLQRGGDAAALPRAGGAARARGRPAGRRRGARRRRACPWPRPAGSACSGAGWRAWWREACWPASLGAAWTRRSRRWRPPSARMPGAQAEALALAEQALEAAGQQSRARELRNARGSLRFYECP